jgi:hypothetical protein
MEIPVKITGTTGMGMEQMKK